MTRNYLEMTPCYSPASNTNTTKGRKVWCFLILSYYSFLYCPIIYLGHNGKHIIDWSCWTIQVSKRPYWNTVLESFIQENRCRTWHTDRNMSVLNMWRRTNNINRFLVMLICLKCLVQTRVTLDFVKDGGVILIITTKSTLFKCEMWRQKTVPDN